MRCHREAEAGEEYRGNVEHHHQGDLDLVLVHGDDVKHCVLQKFPVINDPLSVSESDIGCGWYPPVVSGYISSFAEDRMSFIDVINIWAPLAQTPLPLTWSRWQWPTDPRVLQIKSLGPWRRHPQWSAPGDTTRPCRSHTVWTCQMLFEQKASVKISYL